YGWFLYTRLKTRQAYTKAESLNQIIVPEHSKLLEADVHYNPTIEFIENRWLMVYRIINSPNERQLVICELDQDFQPKSETNINLSELILDFPDAQRFHSDARFFRYKNRLFINYNNRNICNEEEVNLYVLEISAKTLRPIGSPRKVEIAPNPKLRR